MTCITVGWVAVELSLARPHRSDEMAGKRKHHGQQLAKEDRRCGEDQTAPAKLRTRGLDGGVYEYRPMSSICAGLCLFVDQWPEGYMAL
jgi:hypothetical protein